MLEALPSAQSTQVFAGVCRQICYDSYLVHARRHSINVLVCFDQSLLTRPVARYANAVEHTSSYSATRLKLILLQNGITLQNGIMILLWFRSASDPLSNVTMWWCIGLPLHIGLHKLDQCSEVSGCQSVQASFACMAAITDQRVVEECCILNSLPSLHAWHVGSSVP